MSDSSAPGGEAGDKPSVSARASHTHLFPGARVLLDGVRPPLRPEPVSLRFSDGVRASAELLAPARPEEAWLFAVDAHRTAAGTSLPDRMWLVSDIRFDAEGAELRLGSRLPGPSS